MSDRVIAPAASRIYARTRRYAMDVLPSRKVSPAHSTVKTHSSTQPTRGRNRYGEKNGNASARARFPVGVINNAGYGSFGAIEEVTEAEARAQIETNLFGALLVTRAAVPIMREQKSGHIISISSIGGIVAFPNIGLYHASKWCL